MTYTITKDTIKNASIPTLRKKYEFALLGGQFITNKQDGFTVVNSYYKQLYTLKIIATDYLHLVDVAENHCISEDEYNDLLLSNIFSQVKSFTYQTDKDVSGKAKAILRDFKTFEDMLEIEIANEISVQNDTLNRFSKEVELNATPEAIEQLAKQAQNMIDKTDTTDKKSE